MLLSTEVRDVVYGHLSAIMADDEDDLSLATPARCVDSGRKLPATKKRAGGSANIITMLPAKRVKELQASIALWIFSEMKSNSAGMTEEQQYDYIFKLFHGFAHPNSGTKQRSTPVAYSSDMAANTSCVDDEMAAYDQFLKAYGAFAPFWESGDVDPSIDRPTLNLKADMSRDYYCTCVANVHINRRQLATATSKMDVLISGRTLWDSAKKTLAEAKKFLSLITHAVKANIITKVDGVYVFCSGMNHSDFVQFILFRMYNWQLLFGNNASLAQSGCNKTPCDAADSIPGIDANEAPGVNVKGNGDEPEESPISNSPVAVDNQALSGLLRPEFDSSEDSVDANADVEVIEGEGGLFSRTAWEEDQLERGEDPPVGYNPRGFMPFMAWGPVGCTYAVPSIQLKQLFQDDNDKAGSRRMIRKNLAKSKDVERDFDLGIADVPLAANDQKEIAIIAQRQMAIEQGERDSEILRLTQFISGANERLKSTQARCEFLLKLGNNQKLEEAMAKYESIDSEIEEAQKMLMAVKGTSDTASVEVTHFLKRGRSAMGIETGRNGKKGATALNADTDNADNESHYAG